VTIALNHLRRNRRRFQSQALADRRFNRGIEMRERADGAGDLADPHDLPGAAEAFDVAAQLRIPERQLQAERHHLGVHAVRAADHRRLFVFSGARLDGVGEPRHELQDQIAGFDHLQRLGRIDNVGRRQAEMEPARGRSDLLGHRRGEGDDVVLRGFFDFVDARDVERVWSLCGGAQVARRFRGDNAGVGHRFGRRHFHLEPRLVLALLAPDAAHFRVRVTRNHRWGLERKLFPRDL
jgi:hypothetical protein